MSVYTVHEPPLRRYEAATDPERFRFVRDGFAFWAFLLAPLWMLRHRMWLALIGYVVVVALMEGALHLVGASATARTFAVLALSLLVGIEAGTLRRFALGRRRWTNVGIVVGDDLEAAERRFFDAWVRSEGPVAAMTRPAGTPPRHAHPSSDVIGLFPEPGAQR
jgi:hypothetical protein